MGLLGKVISDGKEEICSYNNLHCLKSIPFIFTTSQGFFFVVCFCSDKIMFWVTFLMCYLTLFLIPILIFPLGSCFQILFYLFVLFYYLSLEFISSPSEFSVIFIKFLLTLII